MKKSILNIGKALDRAEQKQISGGGSRSSCQTDQDCEQTGLYCPGKVVCVPGFNVCLGVIANGGC